MKRKITFTIQLFVFFAFIIFGLSKITSPSVVKAEEENTVDLSTFSLANDKLGGSIIAPYDGIAMITKAVKAGDKVEIVFPIVTNKNIAIEIKNFTKNGVAVTASFCDGTSFYTLNSESKSYTILKSNNKVAEVTGANIQLNTTGTGANGYEAFNGYIVLENTISITSVTISIPLDAAEKVFIGKIYEVEKELTADEVYDVTSGNIIYTPSVTNFAYSSSDYATVKYASKNTIVLGAGVEDEWEESRIYLSNLEEDGRFKLSNYKYLVVDVDFSNRTSTSFMNLCFFESTGNKYNADRLMFETAYAVGDDGVTTKVILPNMNSAMSFSAGFKGKIYYSLSTDNMCLGANWKDAKAYDGYVFKQMMLYLNGKKNIANVDKDAKINIYFTNTDVLSFNEVNVYALTTSVTNASRGKVEVDTTSGIIVTPVPYENYKVDKVLVNDIETELVDGKLSFETLTENKNVVISFVGTKEIAYSCNSENVTITTDDSKIYNGDDRVFNIVAKDKYTIKSIKVNGKKVSLDANNNISLTNISENIVFEIETEEAGKATANSENIVMVNEYAGGTIWTPFDSIAVASKALANADDKLVTISIPVTTAGYFAIRIKNMNRTANCNLLITVKKGESEYCVTSESIYYLVENGIVTERTGIEAILSGTDKGNGEYYGFNGYVIIPNEEEIDAVLITIGLMTAKKFFIGNIYSVESIGETYVADESSILYSPQVDNYTVICNDEYEELVYISYLEKDTYMVVGPHTGSDGWEQTRLLLSGLEEDNTINLSKWNYLVLDADFSERTIKTRISFVFFSSTGKKWNADRAQSKTLIGVGDDGSYFTATAGLGGAWYVPAGFKGKLYLSVKEEDMNFGANYKDEVSKTNLSNQAMLYMLAQDNKNSALIKSKLSIYLTNEVLPEYEVNSIKVEVSDSRKGSAIISTCDTVIKGSSTTLIVTPKTGYLIDKVLVNGVEVTLIDNEYEIQNITEDINVSIIFTNDPSMPKFTYIVTKDDNVTVSTESQEIPFGTDAKFTFSVDFGYRIKSVKVNGEEVVLENDSYTLTAIESNVTIEVVSEEIPLLEGTSYDTNLGKSYGSSILKVDHVNNFYADFDSIFVSGILYSRDVAKEICPQPYIGLKLKDLAIKDYSSQDVIIIQYRHYHTQSASASGNGIKVSLVDANGKESSVASGKPVYLIDNSIAEGASVYTNSSTYVSGGMIFVPNNFSGYLVLPKSSFTAVEGFDYTNVNDIIIYDDYRWWSDSGSRYAIGNCLTGLFSDNKVSSLTSIWNVSDGLYEEYLNAMDGNSEPFKGDVKFSDFAFTEKFSKGNLYFFDYTKYFSKYTSKGITVSLSDEMLQNGYYDFRTAKAIRFIVDNSSNEQNIPFGLTVSIDGVQFALNALAKVVYYDLAKGEAEYGSLEIPAGFKGYIDIYFEEDKFTAEIEGQEFSLWLDKDIQISLPESSTTGIISGTHFAFDMKILTNTYEFEYTEIKTKEYKINYNLDGGVNNEANKTTYKALEEVILQEPTKEGYEFAGWYLTTDFTGDSITMFKDAIGDITLYAKWSAHFTITYNVSGNGQITPKKTMVEAGTTLTQLLFPDDGYEIVVVKVNGKAVSLDENDSFKIENIQENITIEVVFEKEEVDEKDDKKTEVKKTTASKTTTAQKESDVKKTEDTTGKTKKGCQNSACLAIAPTLLISLFGIVILKKRKSE